MLMLYIEYYLGLVVEDEFFFWKVCGEYKDIFDLRIRLLVLKKLNICIVGFFVEMKYFEDGIVWYNLFYIFFF